MLFHELDYLLFLFVVVALYWLIPPRFRNPLLLSASGLFYCVSSFTHLPLIVCSIVVDYFAARAIQSERYQGYKKWFLVVSVTFNLALLFTFKYYDLFIVYIGHQMGWTVPEALLVGGILPLGISFYTFQTISYTVDCYRGHIKADRSFLNVALYVSFFPQLVAGPIERAGRLLTQVQRTHKFSIQFLREGVLVFVWGFCKKVYVGDGLAPIVQNFFEQDQSSLTHILLIGWLMVFQVYYDFSGYTDMARGAAKLLGYDLRENFKLFIFAKSYGEFWQRWHITLTHWVRDYLYFPLKQSAVVTNLFARFVSFFMIGAWHGPTLNWFFFGVYNWTVFEVHRLLIRYSKKFEPIVAVSMLVVIPFAGLFFFVNSWEQFDFVFQHMNILSFQWDSYSRIVAISSFTLLPVLSLEVFFELQKRQDPYLHWSPFLQAGLFGYCAALATICGSYKTTAYLYFRF